MADGAAEVGRVGERGVGNEIIHTTAAVTPDVAQVQPVAHLVGSGAAQVERRSGRADGAEVGIIYHYSVCRGRAAGKLGIAQQPAGEVAYPDVEVLVGGPGVVPAGGVELDGVAAAAETGNGSLGPRNTSSRVAGRVNRSQAEFDLRVGGLRPDVVRIGVHPAEIFIKHSDLGLYLSVADVLRCIVVNHMHYNRNGDHAVDEPLRRGQRPFGVPLDGFHPLDKARILALEVLQMLHGAALALLGRGGGAEAEQQERAE